MSDPYSRKSRRRVETARICKKQADIKKSARENTYDSVGVDSNHRYAKQHSLNCGKPRCSLCGNPRKIYGSPTFQEQKFLDGVKIDKRNTRED